VVKVVFAGVVYAFKNTVGQCRLTVSKLVLKAPMVSAFGGRCRLTVSKVVLKALMVSALGGRCRLTVSTLVLKAPGALDLALEQ